MLSTILISSVTLISTMYIFGIKQQTRIELSNNAYKVLTAGLKHFHNHFRFDDIWEICSKRNAFDRKNQASDHKKCFQESYHRDQFNNESLRDWTGGPLSGDQLCMVLDSCTLKASGYLLEGTLTLFWNTDPSNPHFQTHQSVFRKVR